MVNMTSIEQRALDVRRKLQHLDRALRINPYQLVDIAFTMPGKNGELKQATIFLETLCGNQERQDPKGKGSH